MSLRKYDFREEWRGVRFMNELPKEFKKPKEVKNVKHKLKHLLKTNTVCTVKKTF